MKTAYSIKLQDTITANKAEYTDHNGFLLCESCWEPVFLRKAHTAGNRHVSSAFIHHKLSDHTTSCELRVKLMHETLCKKHTLRRQQTIQKLQLSMWKYLKTNLVVDLTRWQKWLKESSEPKRAFYNLCDWCDELLNLEKDINWDSFRTAHEMLRNGLEDHFIYGDFAELKALCQKTSDIYWYRQLQLAWDAYLLFTQSASMKELRRRYYGMVCHISMLKQHGLDDPFLLSGSVDSVTKFATYLIGYCQYMFLTTDWQKLL